MLDKLKGRRLSRKVIAFVVFGVIILVFILWGVEPLTRSRQSMGAGYAAIVNNEVVTYGEFQQALAQQQAAIEPMREQMEALWGKKEFEARLNMMRGQILSGLASRYVLAQSARGEGIDISDGEVRDFIQSVPIFLEEGRFQRERYFRWLEAQRLAPPEFEKRIRRDLVQDRFGEVMADALIPFPDDQEKLRFLRELKLNLWFVEASTDDIFPEKDVLASEVESFSQNPEKAKLIEEHYEQNKLNYRDLDRAKLQHIFIGFKSGDKAAEEKALAKATEIRAQAAQMDFGDLAAKVSEDPVTKEKKGDLGEVSRGSLDPALDGVAFALSEGSLSEPIRTENGFHILKVNKRLEGKQKPLSEVKLQVARAVLRGEKIKKWRDELSKALSENQVLEVDRLISSAGKKWEETGTFSCSAENLPKLSSFGEAMDEACLLSAEKQVPPKLLESGSKIAVLKFKESKYEKVPDTQINERAQIGDAFDKWFESKREIGKIEMNERLLQ